MNRRRGLTPEDMHRAGIGERYWHVSLDAIPDTCEYKRVLRGWTERVKDAVEKGIGLMFLGEFRQGKTAAGIIGLKAVLAHGGTGLFIRADQLTKVIVEKERFDEDELFEDRMKGVDVLMIDDLGEEYSKEYGIGLVEQIIRYRYDRQRCLIITTNVKEKDLVAKYGAGLIKVMKSCLIPVVVSGTHWYEAEVRRVRSFLSDGKFSGESV